MKEADALFTVLAGVLEEVVKERKMEERRF
jgi:hypothetical protein